MAELVTKKELKLLTHKDKVRFSLFCAEQVAHKTDCMAAHKCVEVVGKWLVGEASREECEIAAYAASAAYAAYAAAACAAYYADANANAAYAASAANTAACAADNKKEFLKHQRSYYNDLLNLNKIFEKEVLNDQQ